MSNVILTENPASQSVMALEEEVRFLRQRVFDLETHCELIEQTTTAKQRKKTEEMVRKSEMLSMIGQLAAGVAHEIRNPLTSIKGFLQLMQANATKNEDYFTIMLTELARIEFIISEFLVLAKPQLVMKERRNLIHLLQNIIVLVETHAILNNVQIFLHFEPELPLILCEESQLKQAFVNIMKNAIEAMPDGGELLITVNCEGNDRVVVQFIDDGVGVPEEIMPKLGEPFYTTKEKGTGLGLMVSYKIIENHRGHIQVRSTPQKGTTVEIQLPTE
ncbi:UNVERIFIED_CONTAM: signal transduction histidine kinase [Brevibacillus sp. OAP136]|nr:ATP-binding protein [Brevibacillus fluminis]